MRYKSFHKCEIGLIYKSQYHIFVVDLVENIQGERFTYERLIKTQRGNSAVIICKYHNQYVLVKQFRHAVGGYQLAFPRGFGEPDISIEENVKKELFEELNTSAYQIKQLGNVIADSGICGERVNIVQCDVDMPHVDGVYEGIKTYVLLSAEEIQFLINSNQINDGFTLSAWSLYKHKQQ
jgi:ADP-ribose pyrophosphatase